MNVIAAIALAAVSVLPGAAASAIAVPPNNGSVAVSATRPISGTFDGGMKRYYGVGDLACCTDVEGKGPVFELADGSTLKNVIPGQYGAEGVRCRATCTLENVWFEHAGEGAATFKPATASATMTVLGGGALHAGDNVFHHEGAGGTVRIDGFQVEDFGKLYRSCGNCRSQAGRTVVIANVTATYRGGAIAGINANYGDSATFTNITIKGDPDKKIVVCQKYVGNDNGNEPRKSGSGPDGTNCNYSATDIQYQS